MRKILFLLFCFIVFNAKAQIIFTDVNPDSLVTTQYELDLNNDGTPEFLIEKIFDGGINVVQAFGISNQDSMAGYYGGFPDVVGYPFALSSDVIIGSNTILIEGGVMGGDHPLIMEDAKWPTEINRYLGLRFTINGETYYGWVKIKITAAYASYTVLEYAYNGIAGEAINSGVTSVHENASDFSEMNIFPNPVSEITTISFSLLKESTLDLSVYDLSGKLIFSETKEKTLPGKQTLQLNVSQWNSGIYFCRINTGNNSSTYKLSVVR